MNVIGKSNYSFVTPLNQSQHKLSISRNSDTVKKPRSNQYEKFHCKNGSRENLKQVDLTSQSNENIKEQLEPSELQNQGTSGCSFLILDANTLKSMDKKQALALWLIQKMNDEKNDEEKYIKYFKRLLSCEYFRKENTSFEIDELEYEIFDLPNNSLQVSSNYSKSENSKKRLF